MVRGQPSFIGQSIGGYLVVRKIGEGGMGVVYAARHELTDKQVAIKVILPQFSANPDHIARFHAEARAATTLHHPAFLNVFDFGTLPDGSAFLAMDLLEGRSLRERLRKLGKLPLATALKVARQIAAGMAVAHAHGIIHRDLKPDNVFLELDPADRQAVQIKILDFGVAKLVKVDGEGPVTQSGALLGTPLFMSPEQCRGGNEVDHRTDIYAWACLLFNMLAGHAPFPLEHFAAVIHAHAFDPPPRLRELDAKIPARVSQLVDRCLAKKPGDRPGSMHELIGALDELASKLRLGSLASGPALTELGLALGGDGKLPAGTQEFAALELSSSGTSGPTPIKRGGTTTTLGQSAASVPNHRPPAWRWPWIALVVTGAAAIVALVVGLNTRSRHEAVAAKPQSPPVTVDRPPPDLPVFRAERIVLPPEPAAPSTRLTSTPAGAKVKDGKGVVLGETPLALPLAPGAKPRRVVLSLPGYKAKRALLSPGRDVEVKLRPRGAKRSAPD